MVKIMTTTEYIHHVKQSGWKPFHRRVWQRGYYERIIRDVQELDAIRAYITHHSEHHCELDHHHTSMQYREGQ